MRMTLIAAICVVNDMVEGRRTVKKMRGIIGCVCGDVQRLVELAIVLVGGTPPRQMPALSHKNPFYCCHYSVSLTLSLSLSTNHFSPKDNAIASNQVCNNLISSTLIKILLNLLVLINETVGAPYTYSVQRRRVAMEERGGGGNGDRRANVAHPCTERAQNCFFPFIY